MFPFRPERQKEFREIVQDYEKRKDTPKLLTRKLTVPPPYEVVNEDDVKAFIKYRVTPGIEQAEPNPRFKLVTDLFTFSDVYFSADGRLGITQLSTFCGGLCGGWR